jgi:hypothetical protein
MYMQEYILFNPTSNIFIIKKRTSLSEAPNNHTEHERTITNAHMRFKKTMNVDILFDFDNNYKIDIVQCCQK